MIARAHSGIVIKRTRRNQNHIQDWHLTRNRTATDSAEPVSESLRVGQLKLTHFIRSTQPPKISGPHEHIRGEGGAARFPAPRTVTVAKLRWILGLEGDCAAQTTSSEHSTPPAKAIFRQWQRARIRGMSQSTPLRNLIATSRQLI